MNLVKPMIRDSLFKIRKNSNFQNYEKIKENDKMRMISRNINLNIEEAKKCYERHILQSE